MKLTQIWQPKRYKNLLQTTLVGLCLFIFSIGLSGYTAPIQISMLAQGDAITDPSALLRYSLPIDNEQIRRLQKDIEDLAQDLKGKRWSPLKSKLKDAYVVASFRRDQVLESVSEDKKAQGEALIDQITNNLVEIQEAAETRDKEQVWQKRRQILNEITDLEQLMVQEYPLEIPAEYSNLPQLKGRATVEIETTKGTLTVVADGYSAPVNAGNFVDLVQRGFYDGLEFMANQSDFVVQVGDPPGPEEGFIDPKTKEYRAIPIEYLIRGESEPMYGLTLEEAGIYLADLTLPFSAYGTLALARPADDPNGGSSQVFFFKFDTELTPPGFNVMDGRYSVFGYLVDGKDVLEQLTPNDKIISAKVVQGLDNLVQPS